MTSRQNDLNQPIGTAIADWKPCQPPPRSPMQGRFCRVEPLDAGRHADDLYEANALDVTGAGWTYLFIGSFENKDQYRAWAAEVTAQNDPLFHAVIDLTTGKAVGVATYMRINPGQGVIEVGNIRYSPLLQRKPAATEAMYLMMRRAFDELGYRRYEWKCDALNEPSCKSALRLGFTFEGIFRQAAVYKGRNRDTAWYSIIDSEWPALKTAFEAWLQPSNFDANGTQKQRLGALVAKARLTAKA